MSIPPDFTDSPKESAQSPVGPSDQGRQKPSNPGSRLVGTTQMPYPLNQVVEIPIDEILVNPKQPRRSIKEGSIQVLAASMKVKGQTTPVRTRPLTVGERAANPGQWVMHIGGHRRRAAAILNQTKTLKCLVEDIPPEETHHEAVLDNLHKEMDWWDWDVLIAIENEDNPNMNQRELADWVGVSIGAVNNALKIARTFNTAALGLVDENLQKTLKKDVQPLNTKNKGFLITESILLVLADLVDPDLVLKALQVVLDDYLTEGQTGHFVQWLKAGNRVGDYSAKKVAEFIKTLKTHATKGADSHKVSAHPNLGAGLDDQPQGADTPPKTVGSPPAGPGTVTPNGDSSNPTVLAPEAETNATPPLTTADISPFAKATGDRLRLAIDSLKNLLAGLGENLKQVWQGFKQAGLKSLLGKLPKNPWEALGMLFWKAPVGFFKLLWKFAQKAGKYLWNRALKYAHQACKDMANWVVPIHQSSSSHAGRGRNPLRVLGHYVVYWLLLAVFYSMVLGAIGHLIPSLRPWIHSVVMYSAHLLIQLLVYGAAYVLHQGWLVFILLAALCGGILKSYKPDLTQTLIILALFIAAWWFRGWWTGKLLQLLPAETSIAWSWPSSGNTGKTPVVVSDTTQPTPNPISPRSSGDAEKTPTVVKKHSRIKTSNSHVSGSTPNPALSGSTGSPLNQSKGSSPLTSPEPLKGVERAPNFSCKPWSPSDEDQASFDAELSALPKPCEMMPFPLDTGANISEDMAPRVLGDLADPDKYTVFVGHDKKTIVSASPNPSGLTLAFQGGLSLGGLSGGLLGDAPKNGLEIYWVDVKAIHCNGISGVTDQNQALYQCSWVLPSPRKPITVRCAGAEDLKRLVLAMEFFIRAANGGHGAPISGLPYLNQGVILGGWNKVEVLWAGSPVAEAFGHATGLSNSTLKLGDHLWSLETNTARQSGRDAMEKGLQTLASGKHILFGVASADWDKAQREEKNTATGDFDPLRRQMDLVVP